jgi:hypothetical protein
VAPGRVTAGAAARGLAALEAEMLQEAVAEGDLADVAGILRCSEDRASLLRCQVCSPPPIVPFVCSVSLVESRAKLAGVLVGNCGGNRCRAGRVRELSADAGDAWAHHTPRTHLPAMLRVGAGLATDGCTTAQACWARDASLAALLVAQGAPVALKNHHGAGPSPGRVCH